MLKYSVILFATLSTAALAIEKGSINPPQQLLSLDGGGIRGLISLKILKKIEEQLGAPIQNHVDAYAGTSTGGLIALGLATDHSINEIITLYETQYDDIFASDCYKAFSSLCGLTDEKYYTTPLENLVKKFLGDNTLLTSLKSADVMITATNITQRMPILFSSYAAKQHMAHDHPLWFIARSTSAAPTYFEPTEDNNCALVDGGLIANNPALYAAMHIRQQFGWSTFANLKTLSLGTGEYRTGISYTEARSMGALEWAIPISPTMMQTTSNMNDLQMQMLYDSSCQYQRLQPLLKRDIALDAITKEDFIEMDSVVAEFIHNNPERIDAAVKMLQR